MKVVRPAITSARRLVPLSENLKKPSKAILPRRPPTMCVSNIDSRKRGVQNELVSRSASQPVNQHRVRNSLPRGVEQEVRPKRSLSEAISCICYGIRYVWLKC